MDNSDQANHERDAKIAENEATREMFSKVRVSTWAVLGAIVLILAVAMVYQMAK